MRTDSRPPSCATSIRRVALVAILAPAAIGAAGVPPALATTLTVPAAADATIRADMPATNLGSTATLQVDAGPMKDTLLRFDVPSTTDAIARATLRLHNVNGSSLGGDASRTTSDWDETAVTWENAPPASGPAIGSFGRVSAGNWYEMDVTPAVTGAGPVSFRISSQSTNGADYVSRDGTAGLRPELALELAASDPPPPPPPSSSFMFAAAGDIGANSKASASLAALDSRAPSFFLALGDLRYGQTPTDQAWCDYVIARLPTLGPAFPFQLVAGDQEEQGQTSGDILQLAQCLPDRMGSTLGTTNLYAAEYFFDYPPSNPTARVIMISPDMRIDDVVYTYSASSARYAWVAATIDDARARNIPWVIVGMHRNCINATGKSCAIGTDLFNLLVGKKVDLILQGHAHNYERGKQLALDPATCPTIVRTQYDPDCVVDDGADGSYQKGAGSIVVIAGSFGRGPSALNLGAPDAAYFAALDATTHGFVSYDVTTERLDATFVNSIGSFTDAFSIVGGGSPPPPPPPASEHLFPPVADATVQENKPTSTFGSASTVEVDASARKDFLISFEVTGLTSPVIGARLRLYNVDPSGQGGDVYRVEAPGWTESTLSWTNAPPAAGAPVGSFGPVAEGWREVDVSGAVSGNGTVGFRVQSSSSNGAAYVSKEGTTGSSPVLIVTTT